MPGRTKTDRIGWRVSVLGSLRLQRHEIEDPAVKQMILQKIPMGRIGEESEVAGAVSYLLGPDAGFVTGHVLVLDGGTTVI